MLVSAIVVPMTQRLTTPVDDDMVAKDFFGLIEGWLGRFPELPRMIFI